MANHDIKEPKEYREEIRKFETTDKGHADVFNAVIESLVNNDAYSKEKIDGLSNPVWQEPENMEELVSGESIFSAFGKLSKAIRDFIIHKTLAATNAISGHVKLAYHEDITEPGTYALDAVQANARVRGTIAHQMLQHDVDLSNKVPINKISSSSAVTEASMYVLDAREKNASLYGTMASQIADLNTKLYKIINPYRCGVPSSNTRTRNNNHSS